MFTIMLLSYYTIMPIASLTMSIYINQVVLISMYLCTFLLFNDYTIYANQMLYPYVYIVDLDLICLSIEFAILNKILESLNP